MLLLAPNHSGHQPSERNPSDALSRVGSRPPPLLQAPQCLDVPCLPTLWNGTLRARIGSACASQQQQGQHLG
jgi:hypothetical protein